jgi:hypothetical protein
MGTNDPRSEAGADLCLLTRTRKGIRNLVRVGARGTWNSLGTGVFDKSLNKIETLLKLNAKFVHLHILVPGPSLLFPYPD